MMIDFAWPEGAFGFSSGWNDRFDPDGRYSLTRRVNVGFGMVDAQSIISGEDTILLLKASTTADYFGLSSGAGSSLMRAGPEVCKIKRNGYKYGPPRENGYSNIALDPHTLDEIAEEFQYRGIMTEKNALNEFEMIGLLRKEGLCDAYRPFDVLRYVIPGSGDQAFALTYKISSDLRVDELIFAVLSRYLSGEVKRGTISFDSGSGLFTPKGLSFQSFLDERQVFDDLNVIGKVLGSNYRQLHDKGFLRGYPHSWFSNEVIDAHGKVSFVDMEYGSRRPGRPHSFKVLQEIEKTQARNALFSEFETMGLHCLALAGVELSAGFEQGYMMDGLSVHIDLLDRAFSCYGSDSGSIWGVA